MNHQALKTSGKSGLSRRPRYRWMVWTAAFLLAAPTGTWASKTKKTTALGLKVQGLALSEDGKPYFLAGIEASGLYRLSPGQLSSFFKQVRAAGGKVVKTNAFSTGKGADVLQTGPDQWNENALLKLDQMVASAKASGVNLVLNLCADKGDEGGKADYGAWVGSPNPGVFFINFQCKDWYQDYVKMLLTRVNKVTGVKYGSEPAILAWDLIDTPENPGDDPGSFDGWIASMGPFVKSLTNHALVAVTLNPQAQGINAITAAGQPGLDFVMDRLQPQAPSAMKWAQEIGKPVVALLDKPEAQPADLCAGALVGSGPSMAQDKWTALGAFFTGLSHLGGFGAKDLFVSVSASQVETPVMSWDAQESIKVVLAHPAQVQVRYGLEGMMAQETALTSEPSTTQRVSLSGLAAGKTYTYQLKAVKGDDTQYSNTSTFTALPVRQIFAKPISLSNHFITVKGPHFYDGDKPFRYVGTNNYYLHYQGAKSLEYVMGWAQKLGFTVMRTWGFGVTGKPEKDWADWEKRRYFVTGPGKYREEAFKDMDGVVQSAAKHHIRLVIALANNWADLGGAPDWVKYFGLTDKNDFFANKQVKEAYKDYVKAFVNHVNSISGIAYKDDPTIMAWDLMNEPRDESDTTGKTLAGWIDEMASYIKNLGVKQLVTTGSEGLRAENGTHYSGTDFILDHSSPNIDYATFHVYPSNQYSMWNLETTQALLAAYVKDAHGILKKPVVMEEFGIDKDRADYDRPKFIYYMMKAFYDAGGDGTQYWMLAEPDYKGDNYQLDPTQVDACNTFVLMSNELRGGKGNEK